MSRPVGDYSRQKRSRAPKRTYVSFGHTRMYMREWTLLKIYNRLFLQI